MTPKDKDKDRDAEYDGTGIYRGNDSELWYDTDGNQHSQATDKSDNENRRTKR